MAESIRGQLAAYASCYSHSRLSTSGSKSVLVPLVLRVRAAGLVYEDSVEWSFGVGAEDGPVEAFAMRTVADLGAWALVVCIGRVCPSV